MNKLRSALIIAFAIAAIGAQCVCARSTKTEIAQNLNIFNSIYKELTTNYVDTIDAKKSVRDAIDYMLSQIDPYTEYYPREDQDALRSISSGEYSGIGSTIIQRNGQVVLSEPLWGSPARNAGVQHGDILLAIDGDTLPHGYPTSEASSRLKGQAGTKLRITVQRPYTTDSILDIEIVRGQIKTNPVPYYGMVRDGVGYIRLTTFSEKSAPQVKQALLELKKDPSLKSVVLDLRDNGGGIIDGAVQIVGLFVPKGTEVVRTRYREKDHEKIYRTTQSPVDTKIPLAVLVNSGTASASEIVSGALQDLDRAVIIGERSYGKGLVQSSRPLPYDGLLKVTVARYYIPSGRLIQAIDYSHRNEDGSAARIPDSLTNVFHTAAGREVRDGGGITPDIKVKHREMNRLIYNVMSDMWAYDYATRFHARQGENMPPAADFVVTDSIFEDFKAFIDPAKFKYDKFYDTAIDRLREATAIEGYMNDSVAAAFDNLEQLLKRDLGKDLDYNRDALIDLLDEEISERYYDDAGRVMRSLRSDTDLEEAVAILSDPNRYRAILQVKED